MFTSRTMSSWFIGLLLLTDTALAVSSAESACGPSPGNGLNNNPETDKGRFEQRFTEAEQLRQQAVKAGTEWLKTGELLIRAQQEAGNDNWNTALQLVFKACVQAELALRQAELEAQAWKNRVLQ